MTRVPLGGLNRAELLLELEKDKERVFTEIFENNDELWSEFLEDNLKMEAKTGDRIMETGELMFSMIEKLKSENLEKMLGFAASSTSYFLFMRARAYAELQAKKLI